MSYFKITINKKLFFELIKPGRGNLNPYEISVKIKKRKEQQLSWMEVQQLKLWQGSYE